MGEKRLCLGSDLGECLAVRDRPRDVGSRDTNQSMGGSSGTAEGLVDS